MSDQRLKAIKIQTGVLKRRDKDRIYNEKERVAQEKLIQRYKDEGRDEYDVNKQYEVLEEVSMMVPRDLKAIAEARAELQSILDKENDLADSEEYKAAVQMLADTTPE